MIDREKAFRARFTDESTMSEDMATLKKGFNAAFDLMENEINRMSNRISFLEANELNLSRSLEKQINDNCNYVLERKESSAEIERLKAQIDEFKIAIGEFAECKNNDCKCREGYGLCGQCLLRADELLKAPPESEDSTND
jgi:hypothetical protein